MRLLRQKKKTTTMYKILVYIGVVCIYYVSSEEIPNNANSSSQAVSLSIPANLEKNSSFGLQVEMTKMDAPTKKPEDTWEPKDFPDLTATLLVEVLVNGLVIENKSIEITASHLGNKTWFPNNSSTPVNQTIDICLENSLEDIASDEISIQAYFSIPSMGHYSLYEDFTPTKVKIVPSQNCPVIIKEVTDTDTEVDAMDIALPIIVAAVIFLICLLLVVGFIFHRRKTLRKNKGSKDDISKNDYDQIPLDDVEKPIIKRQSETTTKKTNDLIHHVILDEKELPEKEDLTTPETLPLIKTNITDLHNNIKKGNDENETKIISTPEVLPLINTNSTDSPKNIEINPIEKENKEQKEINILLLGQTGVGKSTFINGFANYLQHETLDEAEAHEGLISPVASQFTITDEVTFEVKTVITGTEDNESKLATQGQSATQNAKAHVFTYGKMRVRIIDTPGIGDTRGVDQDKENFKQILSYISNYDEIHGICILLKPNEARLDVMFRFCIQELLMHLHKSATANMVFCFTNARSTQYKPGDTMQPLRELLNKNELSEDIKLRKEILYFFDNEAFRYLAAIKKTGITFDEQDRALFAASWKRSRETSEEMVKFFNSKPPHKVKNTLSLNDTRRMITEITKPLAEMTKHIQTQIDDVKDQKEEIMKHAGSIDELRKNLSICIKDLVREELEQPRTVCTSPECTSRIGYENKMRTNYMKHCHPECTLDGVATDVVDNANLKRCIAMDSETGNCKECGCFWNKHMHVTYQMKEVDREVIDKGVEDQLHTKKSMVEAKKELVQNAEKKIEEMVNEKETILKISAKFGCFLKGNAITPYNDAMIAYINHQIKEEKDKIGRQTGNQEKLNNLEKNKERYQEEINIIEASIKKENKTPLSSEEMKNLQEQLFNLPNFGANLKKIYMDIENERMAKLQQKVPTKSKNK